MTEHEFHAVVPNPSRTAVLVVGGRLPCVRVAPAGRSVPAAVQDFASEHGVTAPFLRAVEILVDDERVVGLLEFDALAHPSAGEWLELERLEAEPPAPPELAGALVRWRAELRAPVAAERPPWARPGWRDEAERWIRGVLPATRSIRLVRQWPLSCVLRADTGEDAAYFKAVFAPFHHEPAVTEALAQRHPRLVPRVLAVDRERGWMLMDELGRGEELGGLDEERWPEALRALAAVHRAWQGRRAELLALGAPDHSLDVLAAQIPRAFAAARLDAAAVPELRRRVREVARLPPAETLVHGDFHPWNVVDHDGGVVIYDWSDACFGHPLFDLVTFSPVPWDPVPAQVLDAYVAAREDVPASELRRGFELAEPVGCVFHALSYLRITEGLEPGERHLFGGVPRQFLDRTVALL